MARDALWPVLHCDHCMRHIEAARLLSHSWQQRGSKHCSAQFSHSLATLLKPLIGWAGRQSLHAGLDSWRAPVRCAGSSGQTLPGPHSVEVHWCILGSYGAWMFDGSAAVVVDPVFGEYLGCWWGELVIPAWLITHSQAMSLLLAVPRSCRLPLTVHYILLDCPVLQNVWRRYFLSHLSRMYSKILRVITVFILI